MLITVTSQVDTTNAKPLIATQSVGGPFPARELAGPVIYARAALFGTQYPPCLASQTFLNTKICVGAEKR